MGSDTNSVAVRRTSKSAGNKLYNVEFIRFFFSAIIIYYHILNSNIMDYIGEQKLYETLAKNSTGKLLVECFFLLSGYFLFYSFKKHKDITFGRFTYSKIGRLWPVLAFSIIMDIIFNPGKGLYTYFFNALFLQAIGFTQNSTGINWYVSPLFWAFLFYFGLHKICKNEKRFCFATAVITYFTYSLNLIYCSGSFARDVIFDSLSGGLLRALSGIGLGYLVATVVNSFHENGFTERVQSTKAGKIIFRLVISVGEVAALVAIVLNCFVKEYKSKNEFFIVIMFVLLLVCLTTRCGILSMITNNKVFGFFGKYSYSIYMVQQASFYILQKTLWQNSSFVENHALRCLGISVIITIVMGIAVYYIIEKPGALLFKKFEKILFVKQNA